MRIVPAVLTALACLATLPSWAATPSFPCTKATHEAEGMICRDGELADLDIQLADLYSTVLKNTPRRDQAQLKAEQRGWLRGRNDCWKSSDQRGCIKSAYEDRIRELTDR